MPKPYPSAAEEIKLQTESGYDGDLETGATPNAEPESAMNSEANSQAELTASPDFGTNVGEKLPATASLADAVPEDQPARPQSSAQGPGPIQRLPRNLGSTEQKLRLIAGGAFVTAAFLAPVKRRWRIALAAMGTMDLVTGATGYCPVWHLLKVDTRHHDEK